MLVLHAIVKKDHAIRNVFLKSLPRELPLAAFAGDHGGEAAILDPTK